MTAGGKSSFLDKVLGRLDRLDADGLQKVVRRLAREREFLEALFNTIEDGVLVVNARRHIVYLNQAAARLLGLQAETAEGQRIDRLLPELAWERILALDRDQPAGVRRHELEVFYPRPRYLRLLVAPLDRETGGPRGVALILHDATEARQQTREAAESERMQALTLMAASVAHEIGNPLNALHIHLQLMEREVKKLRSEIGLARPVPAPHRRGRSSTPPPPLGLEDQAAKLNRYLEVAKGEVGRLDYIITQFLSAIRPSQPQIRPGDLNQTARETLELLGPELDNRGLLVEPRLARQLPAAAFDPAQIKQALVNLIKNSMQAMSTGGVLTLETGAGGEGVWVRVTDTGGGIPREQLNRIFEPFFTTKQKGSGLGLMIVQRILRDHGGRVELESRVGVGTTFRLWLPLTERRPRLLQATLGPDEDAPEGVLAAAQSRRAAAVAPSASS